MAAVQPDLPDPATASDKAGWPDHYLAFLTTQRKLSPHTVSSYRRDLRQLLLFSAGLDWPALGHTELRRYTSKLHAGGLDPRSIARTLSAWRGFFDWLAERMPLAANPVDGIRAPKRGKSLPKALSVDHAVQLVARPGHPLRDQAEPAELCNRAMFELLYSSGLRVSELAGLDLRHVAAGPHGAASLGWIDLDEREVVVTGKGNKQRKVPVGTAAIDALRAWLAVRPPATDDAGAALFLSTRGSRISPRVLQLRLKAHGQAVGIPANVHPHMLRHSFASHVLQSSGDLRAVQEMLGHASITSTQVYTALDFQHLAQVYDRAHPRAKLK